MALREKDKWIETMIKLGELHYKLGAVDRVCTQLDIITEHDNAEMIYLLSPIKNMQIRVV